MNFLLEKVPTSIINTFISNFVNDFESKKELLKIWVSKINSGEIAKINEIQIQSDFIDFIFNKILNYGGFTDIECNIRKEEKTFEDSTRPDGSLGYFNDKHDIRAIIELKPYNKNFEDKQNRKKHLSTIEQAFEYAYKFGDNCKWIIISDFARIRIYHKENKSNFQYFDITQLVTYKNSIAKKTNEIIEDDSEFRKFIYLLYKDQLFKRKINLSNKDNLPKAEELFYHRISELKDITNKFYFDYRNIREELYFNLLKTNQDFSKNQILYYTQKILDRLLFMRFAFQNNAIKLNTLGNILKLKEISFEDSDDLFWKNFNIIFKVFHFGKKYSEDKIVPKFNGGLFDEDENYQKLIVKDDFLTRYINVLTEYNFKDEIKVEILGHIFEQSITDLEIFRKTNKIDVEDIEEHDNITQRKKDGIYYTPDYITEYILTQTLIKYLREKEFEIFKQLNIDYVSSIDKDLTRWYINNPFIQKDDIIKIYLQYIEKYEKVLSDVKILDPACGSGAFLTKAFDILDIEYLSIIERKKQIIDYQNLNNKFKTSESYFDKQKWEYRKSIVINNLYGVDINLQSVEITKLSLWLKTANDLVPLCDLKKNIKQGNSLIEDGRVKNHFVWKDNFENIYSDLGFFDIVIGNPPYYNIQTYGYNSPIFDYLKKYYKDVYQDKSDILFYFIKKAVDVSKNYISFIVSNAFLFSDKAQKLRNWLIDNTNIIEIINFEKYHVFNDASVTSLIFVLKKYGIYEKTNFINFTEKDIKPEFIISTINSKENYNDIKFKKDNVWSLVKNDLLEIHNKIDGLNIKLCDLMLVGKGMETAANEVFIFNEIPKYLPKELFKKRVTGLNLGKFHIDNNTDFMLYFEHYEKFEDLPAEIQKHIKKNRIILENRATVKNEGRPFWKYSRPMHKEYYHLPKLFCSYRSSDNIFGYDDGFNFLPLTNTTVIFETNPEISIKYILCLLNSKLLTFRYKAIGKQTGGGIYEYFANGIGKLPIVVITKDEQKPLIELADKMMDLKKEIHNAILDKKTEIQIEIDKTENEINKLVCELYELTEEEIKIIENSLKK